MTQTDQRTLEGGFDLHAAGKLEEAEQVYRDVLRGQPRNAAALHLLGVLLYQAGRFDAAVESIEAAIAIDGQSAEFHTSLGMAFSARHDHARAIASFERALVLQPDYVKAHFGLGNTYYGMGSAEQAIVAYRRALWLDPQHAEAQNNLGNALQLGGRTDEAIEAFRQAIHLRPDNAEAHYNLGTALQKQLRFDEAAQAYRQSIKLRPHLAEAHNNLGLLHRRAGQIDQAIECFRAALTSDSAPAAVHNNLGNASMALGQFAEAEHSFNAALSLDPHCVEALNNLGTALHKLGRPAEAIHCYRQALSLRPDAPQIFNNFANVLKEVGWLDEAIACYDRALALRPDDAEFYYNLGNTLKDAGQLDAAITAYRRALELRADYATAHSALLYALHFHPQHNAQEIATEHREWNDRHAEVLVRWAGSHTNDRSLDRRLRIGYVSPDLRDHVVGRFLLPLLAHHDCGRFEIFCYADVARPDAMTERLRSHVDVWRSTVGLSDQRLADLVREEQVDILVDLTMHMGGSRLLAFARKPAPVQVTYLAYCSTTGLSAIDYRLTDPHLDPPEFEDGRYTERSMHLPRSYWCYRPPENTPEVASLPMLSNGYVTFGCLNNFCKVTAPTLEAWRELLLAVPDSRLIVHALDGTHRQRVSDFFAAGAVDPQRIEFIGFLPMEQYLQQFNRIDIALDPFPYGGGTSTCDALWMGVPVVSLAGQTAVGRGGLSILTNIGLANMGRDVQEYLRIAKEMAGNPARLAELRSTLRTQMQASPLMDEPEFAQDVENAYRQMWKAWCDSKES